MTEEQMYLKGLIDANRKHHKELMIRCEVNGHARVVIPSSDVNTQFVICEVCGQELGRRCQGDTPCDLDEDGACRLCKRETVPYWKREISEEQRNLLRLDRELVAKAQKVALEGSEAEVVQKLREQIEAQIDRRPPPKRSILDAAAGFAKHELGLPFSIGDDGLPILKNGERPEWVKPVWEFLTR